MEEIEWVVLQIPEWIEIIFCYIVLEKTRLREIINWMVERLPNYWLDYCRRRVVYCFIERVS